MTVNAMRFIDKYVGIPLCFIATLLNKVFFRPKKGVTPKNILFIELSEMGSAILADPAMRKAQKKYNGSLFFLIFKKNKASLELLQTVPNENIFTIRPELKYLFIDVIRFLLWSRKNKIDTTIDIELFSRFTALLTGFSGADNRVGFYKFHNEGLYRGEMMTHKIAYNPNMHISKNFVAMVNSLEEDPCISPLSKSYVDDSEITLEKAAINEESKNNMKTIIDKFAPENWRNDYPELVLVNANASDLLPQRRWPAQHFIDFCNIMLNKYDNILILLTGARHESIQADYIINSIDDKNRHRCVNFTGKCSLKEMLTLYSISTVMLTNDSGPGHFSAVTDMHSVVIFGPETPKLYGSLGKTTCLFKGLSCSPCVTAANHRKTSCTDNVCIQIISPESVADVVSGILNENLK